MTTQSENPPSRGCLFFFVIAHVLVIALLIRGCTAPKTSMDDIAGKYYPAFEIMGQVEVDKSTIFILNEDGGGILKDRQRSRDYSLSWRMVSPEKKGSRAVVEVTQHTQFGSDSNLMEVDGNRLITKMKLP